MSRNREEFLKLASVKTSTFKVPSLNDYEILMKELTIAESNEFRDIYLTDETPNKHQAIVYACRCSCIEPEFFTDEQLKDLGVAGNSAVMEIWNEIPLIGKNKDEREEYFKKLNETLKADETAKSEEETKKLKKKSVNSSSNQFSNLAIKRLLNQKKL